MKVPIRYSDEDHGEFIVIEKADCAGDVHIDVGSWGRYLDRASARRLANALQQAAQPAKTRRSAKR